MPSVVFFFSGLASDSLMDGCFFDLSFFDLAKEPFCFGTLDFGKSSDPLIAFYAFPEVSARELLSYELSYCVPAPAPDEDVFE